MTDGIDLLRTIFVNDRGEARCGWRIFVFVVVVIASGLILSGVLDGFATLFPSLRYLQTEPAPSDEYVSPRELAFLATNKLIIFFAAIVATSLCARLLERRSFASVGFKLHRGWFRDFALGSALGCATMAIVAGILYGMGAARFDTQPTRDLPLTTGLAFSFFFMLVAAATEELLFRGFAFQALTYDLGPTAAILGTSVLFGLLHLPNPHSTVFSTINTVLAGLWLGAAYLLTRSLWLATALHYSWNFAMACLFGLPVSGITTLNRLSLLRGVASGPRWLSGLDYGPEGGIVACVAILASIFVIWKGGLFSSSEEMKEAVRHGERETMPRIT